MNVRSPLIANPQPAELMQPGQGPLHYPAIDAQAAPVPGKTLGQDRPNLERAQGPALGFRVIGPVSLNLVGSTARAPSPSPNGRNSLHQGQQLDDIVTVSSRENGGQRNPLSIGNHVVFAPQLAPVGRIGPGFFPHRPPLGWRRYPPRPGTSQSGPLLEVWPAAVREAPARPQLPASLADGANTSCPNRSPFPWATFPRECRSSGQTRCQSAPAGRSRASGQGSAIAWAWAAAARIESVPIVHHQATVSPSASPPHTEKLKHHCL